MTYSPYILLHLPPHPILFQSNYENFIPQMSEVHHISVYIGKYAIRC